MKKVCFIYGSPKEKNSSSYYFIDSIIKILDSNYVKCNIVRICDALRNEDEFKNIISADKIVIVSPLYLDALPSTVIEFFVKFEKYIKKHNIEKKSVYAVVNCGFIEGNQSNLALDMVKHFARKVDFNWRFGISVGGGEVMLCSRKVISLKGVIKRPVYKALLALKSDIENNITDERENIMTNANITKGLFMFMGHRYWMFMARKNNLSFKDLYRKIY